MLTEYIGRETLRDLMYTEAFERDTGLQRWDSGLWIRYKLFNKCLAAIPAADVVERPRWIPVTEQLPEDRSDVLAYLKYEVGGRIAAANYDKGMWQDCVMGGLYRTEEGVVTHWMPLPMPPED